MNSAQMATAIIDRVTSAVCRIVYGGMARNEVHETLVRHALDNLGVNVFMVLEQLQMVEPSEGSKK